MPLYAGKYAICAFLQDMQNMLRSHDRYKPVSLIRLDSEMRNDMDLFYLWHRRSGHVQAHIFIPAHIYVCIFL